MATIKDVARLAGVGVGTASRVISGRGSFSEAAAARVAEAARQLEFKPSAIARALSLRSTGTIGIFVPDFKGPFYGPLLDAIDAELRRHERHMVVANGRGDEDSRQQSLDDHGAYARPIERHGDRRRRRGRKRRSEQCCGNGDPAHGPR